MRQKGTLFRVPFFMGCCLSSSTISNFDVETGIYLRTLLYAKTPNKTVAAATMPVVALGFSLA